MDLRTAKTKSAIHNAYMTLRKKYSPEKIKVVDICQLAQINKSTFYRHYRDVFELTQELKVETFNTFWENFEEKGLMLTQPKRFLISMPKAMDELGEPLLSAFFRKEIEDLYTLLENALFDYYISDTNSSTDNLKITFIISGILHVFREQHNTHQYDNSAVAQEVEHIVLSMDLPV